MGARLVEIAASSRWAGLSPLAGAHQLGNVSLAVAAARAVAPLDDDAIARGLRATRWRGRLERIETPGRRPLLVDGAHNPPGALALAAHLDASGLSGTVDLLFGGMADKDLAAVFAPLAARARRVVLVAPGSPRAESAGAPRANGSAARSSRPRRPSRRASRVSRPRAATGRSSSRARSTSPATCSRSGAERFGFGG